MEAIFLRQKPEERDALLRLVPKVCKPCPATDLIVEFRIIDRDIERVDPVHDFLHQRSHIIPAEVSDVIPRNLAPIDIDEANVGIVTRVGNRSCARMKGFETGVAGAHHRKGLRHHGSNTLLVVPIHRDARAANHSKSRSEPILLPRYAERAMRLPKH